MLKKMGLLAAMALAALAFAIPASASAAEFLMEGSPVTPGESETFSGTVEFTTPIGAVHCPETTANIEFTGGGNALLSGFSGMAPCTVSGVTKELCGEAVSLENVGEAELRAEASDIAIPTMQASIIFNKCGPVDLHLTNLTIKLDNTLTEPTKKLEELTLSGSGVGTITASQSEVPGSVMGNLKADGEMGTYEIG